MHASYDEVDAWPLDRVLAANDLLEALARGEDEFRARSESEARARRGG